MTNPTKYEYDVFISYNQNDEAWAKQLATRLEQEDWQGRKLKVFFAPWDIKPGDSIPGRLEYALPRSRRVCLIMSPESADSGWVQVERYITHHFDITEQQTRMIPLYRRACEIPPFLQHINRIDFQDDASFENGYRVLLATIKDEPLPRGEEDPQVATSRSALIPRPPIVGFVARRDSEGRDIIEHLKEELAPQKNQLVVLSGPGGVGKTTLAAETTRSLTERFGDRIVWISALGREDFALSTLLDEIAAQLGRADMRSLAPALKGERIQGLLALAPTLIILDNFETIAPAEQEACVDFLLNQATCPALITTRQRIPSALNIAIPVMSPDEAEDFLQRLIEQTSDPSAFAELDWTRIMKASERNPLVLQWVVAQIDLAQEPNTVLDELAHGEGDAAQRVFDRSFRLEQLGDDGRATLLALSLFAPDSSRAALAVVAGFGEDVKRLNEAVKLLAGLWLTKTAAGGSRLVVEGLTRELAKARLSKDPHAEEFRKRFVDYFLSYTQAHDQPTAEDYEALEVEKENLLRAMDVASEIKDWDRVLELALPLLNPATGMLSVHGYWDQTIQRGKQALQAAFVTNNQWCVGAFANGLGVIYGQQGNYLLAKEHFQLAVDAAERLDEKQGLAATLHELGKLAQIQGELDEAERLYRESLVISKELGNQGGIAATLHQLARLAHDQGDHQEARRLYEESLEISKQFGNQGNIAKSLHQLALLAQDQGEIEQARGLSHESLGIKKELGDQDGIASSLHLSAMLAHKQGEFDEARRLYSESLEIMKALGNQIAIAISLHQSALLAHDQGEFDEARRLYNESLSIAKRLGDQRGTASSLGQLASLAEDEGNNAEAEQLLAEALAIFEKLKSPYAELARRNLERLRTKSM